MAGDPFTVDAAEHQKLMDEWALAIGRFMVAFTSCEYWTYLFVETFGSKRLRDATGDLMLGARAPLAKSLVLDIGLIDDVHKRVEDAFSRLKGLAGTRNLVAHNGPLLHAYRDQDGKLLLLIELRSARDEEKSITIKRLDELTAEARKLDEDLALLYGEVRQPKSHAKK
ncbi:hypothetical protein [Roseateles toxinivorans]|uniref:Uncharacterized protein n=1 Tax=Roseateles toxinivorans TaxID=270368 RepID=A0A4R6QS85_9BURK|nr:hypothetical protein [Roseateles toxinivorans]TDP73115.1 hypothetical protein DES47_102861 [Roseateles toxinivorans]